MTVLISASMLLLLGCRVNVATGTSREPALACDAGGSTAVVWRRPIGDGEYRFYGTVLPDKPHTPPLTAGSVSENSPRLISAGPDRYFFTYSKTFEMSRHLYGLVLNGDFLAVFSAGTRITDDGSATDDGAPRYDIAFDPDLDRVLVVWNMPVYGTSSQLAYRFVHIEDRETFPADGDVQFVPSDAGRKVDPRTILGRYDGPDGEHDAFFVPYINKIAGAGSAVYSTVYGMFLSYPDVVHETVTIASLSGDPHPAYGRVAVAFDPGMDRYLVVCRQTTQIEGYFVSTSGTVSDPIVITDAVTYGTLSTTTPLMLAYSEARSQYELAYYAMPPGAGGGWKNALFTILLDRDGVPVDTRVQRGVSLNVQGGGELDVGADGEFKIAYEECPLVDDDGRTELDEDSLSVYFDSYNE